MRNINKIPKKVLRHKLGFFEKVDPSRIGTYPLVGRDNDGYLGPWDHFVVKYKEKTTRNSWADKSDEFRRWLLNGPESPFAKFVGNEESIRRLKRSLFSALGNADHSCPDNIAFLGPASAGKTVLNKICADVLQIPFIEIHPRSVTTGIDLLVAIAEGLENFILPCDPEHGVKHAIMHGSPHKEYKSVVTLEVLPEGNKYDLFGWAVPIQPNKFSLSRTLWSWLMPSKAYRLNTNMNGEQRAFVVTGEYERVLPMSIFPVQLLKSCLVEDIDAMEGLGRYEIVPEDLALCEFACTSKQPAQEILQTGLDLVKKECA